MVHTKHLNIVSLSLEDAAEVIYSGVFFLFRRYRHSLFQKGRFSNLIKKDTGLLGLCWFLINYN